MLQWASSPNTRDWPQINTLFLEQNEIIKSVLLRFDCSVFFEKDWNLVLRSSIKGFRSWLGDLKMNNLTFWLWPTLEPQPTKWNVGHFIYLLPPSSFNSVFMVWIWVNLQIEFHSQCTGCGRGRYSWNRTSGSIAVGRGCAYVDRAASPHCTNIATITRDVIYSKRQHLYSCSPSDGEQNAMSESLTMDMVLVVSSLQRDHAIQRLCFLFSCGVSIEFILCLRVFVYIQYTAAHGNRLSIQRLLHDVYLDIFMTFYFIHTLWMRWQWNRIW